VDEEEHEDECTGDAKNSSPERADLDN